MNNRKQWHRWTAVLLSMTMFFTSIPAIAFAQTEDIASTDTTSTQNSMNQKKKTVTIADSLDLEEGVSEENAVMDESTEASTTFDLGEGKKMIIYHGQNVRYEDQDGQLHDYDPSLVSLTSTESISGQPLDGYEYENKSGNIKHYIPEILTEETPVITENGEYSISMAPLHTSAGNTTVERISEEVLSPYEQVEEKKVTAVYNLEGSDCRYEYTSLNEGIKETIVLEKVPESNAFQFELNLKGMDAKLDEQKNIVLLQERKSGKTVAVIDKPFMNDASGEAYSEELTYSLEAQKGGGYLLILTVSDDYLSDEERLYPVTIDPTATWKGREEFVDVYVISGSTYSDVNFYDSDVRLMAAGKGSAGSYRTYVQLPNLKSDLEKKYVDSAYVTVYESGDCDAGQTITVNRAYSSWTPSTLTWNNKPSYYASAVNRFTTKGTQYKAHKVSVTTMVRNMLNDTNNPNHGIVLRNTTTSPGYAEFYGSRTTLSAYRPKLVVTYYDRPTVPESISIARNAEKEPILDETYYATSYMRKGFKVYGSWTGISSYNLANVEYKVIAGDDTTQAPTSVGGSGVDLTNYQSTGKSSASGTHVYLPYVGSVPEGKYRIYIRGTDAAGMHGTARYKVFYVDGTPPTLTASLNPSGTTASNPSNNAMPTVNFTASDDRALNYVSISVDGNTAVKASGNSYTLKKDDLKTDGEHTITVTAYDKAGNSKKSQLTYYYKNNGSVVPKAFATHESYGKRVITWELENPDMTNYIYDLHRSSTSGFTPSSSTKLAGDINAKLGYYADKTCLNETTYYYKIVVRPRASSTNLQQQVSDQVSFANPLTESDFMQRTGFKDYLSYFEFGLPQGTGHVEKSSGNLIYEQEDFNLSNAQLDYGLTRTYNSLNTFTGMFGTGWTDSYHKELYIYGNDAYFMDSDGSILKFTKTNDVYACQESKEYTLVKNADKSYTMTAKDETIYKFNRYGQIETITESNGCSLTYTYDELGRLKMLTSQGNMEDSSRTLNFTYSDTGKTLNSIEDHNGTVYSYTYSDGKLTQCKVTDGNDSTNYIAYDYGYTSGGLLNAIKDGVGNTYAVTYTSGKASVITYPNGETYNLNYNGNETAVTKKTEAGSVVYTESITFDSATGKITSATDVNGKVTTYAYQDSEAEIAQGKNPYLLKSETSDFYYQKLDGNTVKLNEHLMQTVTYTYDENDNPDKTTTTYSAPSGITIPADDFPDTEVYDCDYDANHQLTSETTTLDEVVIEDITYTYTAEGNVASMVDVENDTTELYGYDSDGNETSCSVYNDALTKTLQASTLTRSGGLTPVERRTAVYDTQGNAISETSVSAECTIAVQNEYNVMGNIKTTTENRGVSQELSLTTSNVDDSGPNGALPGISKEISTSYAYDFLGREIRSTTTTLLWDEAADRVGSDNPWKIKNLSTEKTYTENGSLASETTSYTTEDPLTAEVNTVTKTTTYVYDNINRNIKTTVSGNNVQDSITVTEYSYADSVNVEDGRNGRSEDNAYMEIVKTGSDVDNLCVVSVKYMDRAGNVIKEETGNRFVCYTYDNDGTQVVSYTGSNTENEYLITLSLQDRNGNAIAEIMNPGVSSGSYTVTDSSVKTESTYDHNGNLLTQTSPMGVSTAYAYDEEDRITYLKVNGTAASSSSRDIAVTYNEDSAGTLTTTITDAKGNQKVEVTDANGLTRQIQDTTASSSEIIQSSFSYDSLGNNVRVDYSDNSYILNEFDVNGRIYRSTNYNKDGQTEKITEYQYDMQGNLTEAKIVEDDGVTEVYREVFSYDADGRLLEKTVVYGSNDAEEYRKTTAYSYDALGRLTSVTYPAESGLGTVTYGYDQYGNLLTIKQNNQLVSEYFYDGFYRISKRKDYTAPGGSSFIQRDHVYDVFGRVTSMVYTKNGNADQILESYAYTYDKNNNIISETHRSNLSGAAIYKNKAYTYDAYGRLTKSVTTDYNNSNAVSTVTYGYDAVGNRTSMTEGGITTTYTYNGLNQLTKKTEGTAVTTYLYDARGNQIQEQSPGATINFTYGVTGEMLTVTNGSTVIQQNEYNHEGIRISRTEGSAERKYLYDNGSVAYTLDYNTVSGANILGDYQNVIGTYRGTDYYVYNKDVQGSTESITDSSFNAKAAYEYADFGEVSELTETIDNEICYTGSIHDETTGLHYMNARYYDPANGRFISQDSYRGELDNPGQWHLYVYCANNPINYVDPSGHAIDTILDVASIAVGVGDVIKNPNNPVAWLGLSADIVCAFVPFLTGGGSAIRGVAKTDDVIDAAREIYRNANKASDVRKATGSYVIKFANGKVYVGKGGYLRAINSAKKYSKRSKVKSIEWKKAANNTEAFINEYRDMCKYGGLKGGKLYNKIWSPGRSKYYKKYKKYYKYGGKRY